ncbi:MAG: hypothetical protein KAX44_00960 [Candidatus Brocadiae bacterium]|nr:hypothetical protein [Candidatus Brocadiia bacterium]
MLNSGLCETAQHGLDSLLSTRAERLASRLSGVEGTDKKPDDLAQVSRDFASLLYTVLVQQMQRTVRPEQEEDGPLSQGVRDFFGLFLPQAVASHPEDALSRYIHQHLGARYGDRLDERG